MAAESGGVAAVVVAAGRGTRMGAETAKPYLVLEGRAILARALAALARSSVVTEWIVVIHPDDRALAEAHLAGFPCGRMTLVAGGARRQDSVRAGVEATSPEVEVVLIHDAVRPFVGPEEARGVVEEARRNGAAVVGTPAFDTLKEVDGAGWVTGTLARRGVWRAATPQAFRRGLIVEAHAASAAMDLEFTDDAALCEHLGYRVRMVRGSPWNIKITTPEDLRIASALVASGVAG